jgi:uncharacterized protein YbbC (DUF1343 family)
MDRRSFLRSAALVTGASAVPTGLAAGAAQALTRPGAVDELAGDVLTGFDVLARDGYRLVRGERVGLISNPTGVVADLTHEVDVMAAAGQVDLVAAFGPEHGFRGSSQAGGSEGDYTDPRTGVAVYDTYGKSPAQIAEFFRQSGVETVMFDIQYVGARFYTRRQRLLTRAPWGHCAPPSAPVSCSTGPVREARTPPSA